MIGQTNAKGGGGGASAIEVVNISLVTNQQEHEDLLGAIVKVTVNGLATEYVWEGEEITVSVPAYMTYVVEYGAVEGYATPEGFAEIAVAGNAQSLMAEYKTCVISVNFRTNQSSHEDVANATATVKGTTVDKVVASGGSVKVPVGEEVTVSASEIIGYKKPEDQTVTASEENMTVTGIYQTEVVSVTLNADNGESMNGQSVTINGKTSVWNGTPITQKVAFGTSYEISVDEKEDYIAPSSVSYTASQARREVVMAYVYHPTTDLSRVDIHGNPIAQNTANCYVIKEAGKYMFPIAYGAAIKNGAVNAEAYTKNSGTYSHKFVNYNGKTITSPYVETDTATQAESVQISVADINNAVTNLEIVDGENCRYVAFKVPEVHSVGGNAVISILDASGVIMWSWHLWLWSDDLTPVEITNATNVKYKILPYNLGSRWYNINKTHLVSWFYQFGRPTPMLPPRSYNETSDSNNYGVLNFSKSSIASDISSGIKRPAAFFKTESGYNSNWFKSDSKKTYNLWDAACTSSGSKDNDVKKTVYDPCPVGFKMPNGNTFTGFSISNVVGDFANGYKFKRYSGDTVGIFFPASGHRGTDGILYLVGSGGYMWTSAPYSTGASYCLYFTDDRVLPQSNTGPVYGQSVRPVQDSDLALPTHKLTINVSGDEETPSGYEIGIYGVSEIVDETTGEVTETLGDLIASQTTPSDTHELTWGTRYKIVASDVDGFTTPASQTYVADSLSRNVSVVYNKIMGKDLSMFDVHGNPITQSTANCYVVKEAGDYMIPVAYGAAIKNGAVNAASFTNNGGEYSHDFVNYLGNVITSPYVEVDTGKAVTSVQMSISDTENAVTNLKVINNDGNKYVAFNVPSVPATGANAVISVKDADGVIMWSWHIWLWPHDLTPVEITNSTGVAYNIMPVNLATILDTADSINQTTGWKNWFYQFGRPNPMLCPSAYNSTDDHTSYGALSYAAVSIASNIQTGIKNPATFYKIYSLYHNNWFETDSDKNYNLWDAACTSNGNSDNNVVKTIYDPCPIGFKMPNGNTFTYFSKSNVVGSFANGWKFKRYSSDTVGVFFPASGDREDSEGMLSSVGSSGSACLSSAYDRNYAYYLYFGSGSVNPSDFNNRVRGLSVRPVTDTDIQGQNKRTKIRIDQTITDPEAMITRIVDLGGIEAIRANSHRYTGTFADGKMTLKQLDDADGTKYVDGTAADLATIGTDVWMKLPQFHWKCTEHATDVWDFEVVYGAKLDDTYKTWDGNDLIGVYEAYYSSNKLYSVSGKESTGSEFQDYFKAYARARGEGFSLVKWKHHCMMAMLYYTMYGDTNCQKKIGKGLSVYNQRTGLTNSLGMMDTVAGGNGNYSTINFWGLESWWGHKYEWVDNVMVDARVWKVTEDDGTVRQAGTGGSSSNYISKMLFGESIDLIPTAASGSNTTGFCDYYDQSSGNSRIVRRSGSSSNEYGGVACVIAVDKSSTKNSDCGSRLAFRGDIVIE